MDILIKTYKMMRLLTITLVFVLPFAALTSSARAGAWLLPHKQSQMIQTLSYQHFSSNTSPKHNAQEHALNYDYFSEYGLFSFLTMGMNVHTQMFLDSATFTESNDPYDFSNSNLTTTAHARFVLWENTDNEHRILSLQPGASLHYHSHTPDHLDPSIELTALYGYSFNLWHHHSFTNLALKEIYFTTSHHHQLQTECTFGIDLNDQWMLMPQLFTSHRFNTSTYDSSTFRDKTFTKFQLQLSLVRSAWDDYLLQLGATYTTYPHQNNHSVGLLISLWKTTW